ncbi:hypothetical protein H0A36_01405 [Endozoicomonas sp. SM1973]|uniref:Uncharacterized protein n=1 Tax=Spartinivicinus marinus TaxID=2994442 RepID=A0A853I368_9GAMM|nr:hypothetical protein [Spartinivicinus marinus]MCX4026810.1 hypothetical protein [Spartinivicinus marinus]NYZ64644.1 hypothetical protein [Spartinivicinus marinus]
MNAKQYLSKVLWLGGCLASMVILFNWLVDPYLLFGTPRISGLNYYKADINNYVRVTKAYQPSKMSWDTLIVGNSRVEMGLDPTHQCFQGRQVYNLAVPGASIKMQLHYALNLIYQKDIKEIYLGVDFTDFLIGQVEYDNQQKEDRLYTVQRMKYTKNGDRNTIYQWQYLIDNYQSLFTLNALFSSFKTVIQQIPTASDRTNNGFNPARDYLTVINTEGAVALFSQKLPQLDVRLSRPTYLFDKAGNRSNKFDELAAFLQITKQRKIKINIFTNPFHNNYWNLINKYNHTTNYQQWQQMLLDVLEVSKHPFLAFWDFANDRRFGNEQPTMVKTKGEALQWFWEPSHYRKSLGDIMLNVMNQPNCNIASEQFGAQLMVSS